MKKYLKTTIVVLGLGLLCFFGYKVYAKISYKSEVKKTIQNVPDFSFETLDKQLFTKNNLAKDKATVFIYFNSHCDYCQHEATTIQEHIKEITNTQLIFVSDEDPSEIREFAKKHKLNTYDHINFLSDPRGSFTTLFDAQSVPYLLIYNKEKQLLKQHKGQIKVEKLLAILSQHK